MNMQLLKNVLAYRIYLILLIIATLPFNIKLNSIFIISYCVFFLLHLLIERPTIALRLSHKETWLLVLPIAWFLLHAIFLVNTDNLKNGFFELEKRVAFVTLLPFLFLDRELWSSRKRALIIVFIASFNIYEITSLGRLLLIEHGFESSTTFLDIVFNFRDHYTLRSNSIYDMHTTFFGLYAIVSIVFGLELFLSMFKESKSKPSRSHVLLLSLSLLLHLLFSILISSRMPFLILLILMAFNVYRFKKQLGWKIYILPLSIVLLFCGALIFSKTIKDRFIKEFKDPLSYGMPKGRFHNSLNMRLAQLYCCKEIISQTALFGVGTGDVQDELNTCYVSNDFSAVMVEHKMDSHNEFLETFMRTGVAGFITLVSLFFIAFSISIKRNDYLFFNFMAIIFISMFTETTLTSQKGVVLFVLFYALLAFPSGEVKTNFISGK